MPNLTRIRFNESAKVGEVTLPQIFHLGIFSLRLLQTIHPTWSFVDVTSPFFQPKVGQFDHKLGIYISSQSLGKSGKSKLSKAPMENYGAVPGDPVASRGGYIPSNFQDSTRHPAWHVLWDLEVFQRLHAKPWRKGTPNDTESEGPW